MCSYYWRPLRYVSLPTLPCCCCCCFTGSRGQPRVGTHSFWRYRDGFTTVYSTTPFLRLVFSTTGCFDDCYNSTKIYSTTVFSTTDTIRQPFFRRLILFDGRFFDNQDFSTTSFLADFLIDRGGFCQTKKIRRNLLRANFFTVNWEWGATPRTTV